MESKARPLPVGVSSCSSAASRARKTCSRKPGVWIGDGRWVSLGADPADVVPSIPRSADGVYVGAALSPMVAFVQRYSARHHDVSKRLLANAALLYDPQFVSRVPGLVAAGGLP